MIDLRLVHDPETDRHLLEVPLQGRSLLENSLLNKGTAFSARERREFGLLGLLPPRVETLDEQIARAFEEYSTKENDLERHIFLRWLEDQNETVFYGLVAAHIAEMVPIIYTPVVGEVCQRYSHVFREPRGLFIAYPERDEIDAILDNRPYRDVDVIVVTDGERILGLGDQGVGGIGIPIGKLALYCLCGGIDPARTLPILLDTGTDNRELLDDPLYAGWRNERVRGPAYDDFIEAFVRAVERKMPNVLLQWEDFAQANATRILEKYRDRLCTFNDDIQGTAAVTLGTLMAAVKAAGSRLTDQRIVVLGAGSAGCGISEQIRAAMVREGLPEAEARSRFWLVDRPGLLLEGMPNLLPFQERFAQPRERLEGWTLPAGGLIGLREVVANVHPTALIGVSGQPGLFTEEIVREMAAHVERPIIFPLSNPTSRSEAKPADLIAWTEGRALIATGSPFPDVHHNGRVFPIAQCNNCYIFPAMGLAVIATGARRVSDAMFVAAARALGETSPALREPGASLLPPLTEIREVARRIAVAAASEAIRQGLADPIPGRVEDRVVAHAWESRYRPLRFRASP